MSNNPYKRRKYQKQNGFDVPYWDINALPFDTICDTCERYEITNESRTSTLLISYVKCLGSSTETYDIGFESSIILCSCEEPQRISGSSTFVVDRLGVCP